MDTHMQQTQTQPLSPYTRRSSSSSAVSTRSTSLSTDASAVRTSSNTVSFNTSSSISSSGDSTSSDNNTSSGCVSNGQLAMLRPVDMRPDRYTDGMAAVAFLRTIDSIRIERFVKRSGVLHYVVDVYLQHSESRIPTNVRSNQQRDSTTAAAAAAAPLTAATTPTTEMTTTAATAPTAKTKRRVPDFQVERTFRDFTKLRSRAYHAAQHSHGIMRCALCDDVVTATLLGERQPKRYMNLMYSRAVLATVLADYLGSAVATALRHRRVHGSRACDAQEQIPLLLRGFLTP